MLAAATPCNGTCFLLLVQHPRERLGIGHVPAVTATAVMISDAGSSMMCALCPSKRSLLDLRPCRISGSVVEITRSLATPFLLPARG